MTTNRELKPGRTIRFSDGTEHIVLANHAKNMNGDAYMMRLTIRPANDPKGKVNSVYVVADGDADVVA